MRTIDENCPRCGAALTHEVRRPSWRDWFVHGGQRAGAHHLYTCPTCGLTGGYGTIGSVWTHPAGVLSRLRRSIGHFLRFHNFMPAPLTWLVCLLLAEIMAATIAVAGGISLWLTGWAVPLAGWLALKALDVGMKPSSYRRHESRRDEHDREDLLVRAAGFRLYVVPPETWAGDVSLGGSGSSGAAITHVDFLYVDDALRREDGRGYLIVDHEPREFREFSLPLFDEEAQGDHVVNFASRFADIRTNAITGPTAGPRRVMNDVEVVVAGALKRVERVGFLEHPNLFLYHVPLEDVEVLLLGWRMTDDELRTVAGRLEPMEDGSDLFRRMKAADRATRERFREEHDEHRRGGTAA